MKTIFKVALICAGAYLLAPQLAQAEDESAKTTAQSPTSKPPVGVLGTGGTIAGSGGSGYRYTAGELTIEDLIKTVPNIDKLARLSGEQVANIGSQDMSDGVWLKLAARVNSVLARPDVMSVVITHGTDTMEETDRECRV